MFVNRNNTHFRHYEKIYIDLGMQIETMQDDLKLLIYIYTTIYTCRQSAGNQCVMTKNQAVWSTKSLIRIVDSVYWCRFSIFKIYYHLIVSIL